VVFLVRHAQAERSAAGGDAARRLTPGGREAFGALAARLGPRLAVRRILSSPFARARETAALLAAATGAAVEEEPALASGASSGTELLAAARRAGGGAALVGHNPELAEAVAAAGRGDAEVPPGAVACVELGPGGAARLLWLEAPARG
jgi:phosphohistidine phosphatase